MNILVIYAHPDDAEFLASGSMAKWVESGHEVYAVSATDGSMGSKIAGRTRAEIAEQRKGELTRAMGVIGGHEPIGFWYPDGFLENHREELREKLAFWIRKLEADRIVTLDPWLNYEIHPDHLTVGRIASEVATFTCFPLYFPEQIEKGLQPHQPREVWYMVPTQRAPNRIVDITATFDKKVRSLLCHESQMQMLADWFLPDADPRNLKAEQREQLSAAVENTLRGMATALGQRYQIPLAEAFYAIGCGPGHLDIMREGAAELLGKLSDGVEVL